MVNYLYSILWLHYDRLLIHVESFYKLLMNHAVFYLKLKRNECIIIKYVSDIFIGDLLEVYPTLFLKFKTISFAFRND